MTEAIYLDLSAEELQRRNTSLKRDREAGQSNRAFQDKLIPLLKDDKTITAVTICFANLEGKLHLIDYNKDFFLDSYDNLTFDGSSIIGFSELGDSDLRLFPDWTSFRWLPADIFGSGKVLLFAGIANEDGSDYESDMRTLLANETKKLRDEKNMRVFAAPEVEGFLLEGMDAEQEYVGNNRCFTLCTKSGYYSSLPQDDLRQFIDAFARALGMLGFENEKDHPEVAPAQFELNYKYTDALAAADQILLYKLVARQIAKSRGYTACFLPKPVAGINGSGMHMNISVAQDGKNLFFDQLSPNQLSPMGIQFAAGILNHAKELCLLMNSSVNSYRRLDPNYEAPNQIKISAKDRGSMIRLPMGNEKSKRIEVRTVAPDANPYMTLFALIRAGFEGVEAATTIPKEGEILPSSIDQAIDHYIPSKFLKSVLGEASHAKYLETKVEVCDRSPRALGAFVKTAEVIFHHEVTNQYLWSQF